MAKLPALMFYPGDWEQDYDLQRSSLAARGTWMGMICRMHRCEPRGLLATNGVPWTVDDVARTIAGDFEEVRSAVTELIENRVAKVTSDGVIYCSRIVRDEVKRLQDAERKRRERAGEPVGDLSDVCPELVRVLSGDCPTFVQDLSGVCPANVQRLSGGSSYSISYSDLNTPPTPPGGRDAETVAGTVRADSWEQACSHMTSDKLRTEAVRAAWEDWTQMRREKGNTVKGTVAKKTVAKLEKYDHDIAVRALDESATNGWTGVFPDKVAQRQQVGSGKRSAPGQTARSRKPNAAARGEYPEDDSPLPTL